MLKLPAGDLRRAVASSSDLKSQGIMKDFDQPLRRSLDMQSPNALRSPLFDDDYDTDTMAQSTASLDSDFGQVHHNGNNSRVVDAMQAALTDIMDEPEGSIFYDPTSKPPQENDSRKASVDIPRALSPRPQIQGRRESEKPSIASLGLVGEPRTRGVFNDDLFGDEEKFLEDEVEDPTPSANKVDDEDIHEAAPGDLGLAEAIDALTSLQREIQRKELQRQQYIVQESDNSLYGRATVFIQSIMVGTEEDGKEYAMCECLGLESNDRH